MAAGLGILFLSITAGIAVGVVLSLLLLISRASEAQLHRLGRTYDALTYRDISRHDDVVVDPDVLVVRLDGPLFFANANRFHDQLTALLDDCDPEPKIVVADMEAVAQTDTDGADVLTRLAHKLRQKGIWFGLARVKGSVLDHWRLAGAIDDVGANRVFADVGEAVEAGRATVGPTSGST